MYAGKTFLLPSGFTLDGYAAVFQDPNIVSGFLNSVKYTLIGTVFSVTMLYITAYPMAQRDLPGRKFFSIFSSSPCTLAAAWSPTYLVVKSTGLVGSMWSLFLPGGVAVGNMIIVRNYFQNSVPKDLIEAAQIDGCSKMGIFLRIVIPLSKPILAVMAVFLHGGLLERLVYRTDLSGRQRLSAASGHAEHPDQSSASASQAATISGGYAELNKTYRAAEILFYDRGGSAHAGHLSLCPSTLKRGFMAGAVKGLKRRKP